LTNKLLGQTTLMDKLLIGLLVAAPIIVIGICFYFWPQRTPNNPPDQPGSRPGKTSLSIFLFVLGVLAVIGAVGMVFTRSDGIFIAVPVLAVAAVFFALSRALDYLDEIAERQKRLEARLDKQSDKT